MSEILTNFSKFWRKTHMVRAQFFDGSWETDAHFFKYFKQSLEHSRILGLFFFLLNFNAELSEICVANSFGQEFVVFFTYTALFHFSECWPFTCWCAKCIIVVVNKLLIFDYWFELFSSNSMFLSQAEAFNVERPCSPPETGGTLQWGCFNCRDYDR